MPERLFEVPEDNFEELEGVRWSFWWWLTGLVDNATKPSAKLENLDLLRMAVNQNAKKTWALQSEDKRGTVMK